MPRRRIDRVCKCGAVMQWCFNVCHACSAQRYFRSRYLSGGQFCQSKVAVARRQGLLAPPSVSPCSDCGGPATEYDHRDYNQPLLVAPVCRGCNARRGKAIPRTWAAGEWDAYVASAWKANRGSPDRWQPAIVRLQREIAELRPDIFGAQPAPTEARL